MILTIIPPWTGSAKTGVLWGSCWSAPNLTGSIRAHRIGQIRDVHIYRFISKHTVEEAMLRKANQKRSLDDMVIRDGEFDWRKVMISDIQMEQALEQVEDIEDAQAARNAAAEMYRDYRGEQQEFDENVLPTFSEVSANDATPGAGEEDEEQDELEGLSGVERYMIRFVESDWSFFSEWRIK
jgi:helicase SWR1